MQNCTYEEGKLTAGHICGINLEGLPRALLATITLVAQATQQCILSTNSRLTLAIATACTRTSSYCTPPTRKKQPDTFSSIVPHAKRTCADYGNYRPPHLDNKTSTSWHPTPHRVLQRHTHPHITSFIHMTISDVSLPILSPHPAA